MKEKTPAERKLSSTGWLEAAVAWEVCASLHLEYCKGRDPFFKTRQADYLSHASECRKKHKRVLKELRDGEL